MKNILLIPNRTKDIDLSVTKRAADVLSGCGATLYLEEKYCDTYIKAISYKGNAPSDIDLIVVIGGDGSILDASAIAIEKNVPLLGINLGKLGYLSEVDVDNMDLLNLLFENKYTVEDKMLLEIFSKGGDSFGSSKKLAVNDIVISHDSFVGIAEFTLEKDDGEHVKYRGDGIIFSTPVGSTAYSLSAGGPIVSHGINAIIVTPIAPHSFFNRSIIFSPRDRLEIKNDGKTELKISIDGRLFATLLPGETSYISVSAKTLKILSFNPNNTFSTLFKKMRILEDIK